MKNVLIINQSAELYGADKALLELIENYPSGYTPIVVVHQEGPLKKRLEELNIKVIKCSVIKVKRGILTPRFFVRLPTEIFSSIRTINRELNGMPIHLVHSNAISVFIGAFYSFFLKIPHLWHVHEIIEHPATLAKWYPKIVYSLSDRIIFNSQASFDQFAKFKAGIKRKSTIVHNGQNRLAQLTPIDQIRSIRSDIFKAPADTRVVIGLIGRISRLKGQKLLLKAFVELTRKFSKLHLVYIGSAPDGQEHFYENLVKKIAAYSLQDKVTIVGFTENIWPIYDALDIVVVPSTEPESFGLVATEAMLSRKPVVGAALGGLKEIIDHGVTGLLFEPKNAEDLSSKLEKLISDREKAAQFGANGYERVHEKFSTAKYVKGVASEYEKLT